MRLGSDRWLVVAMTHEQFRSMAVSPLRADDLLGRQVYTHTGVGIGTRHGSDWWVPRRGRSARRRWRGSTADLVHDIGETASAGIAL
jgi:hypothetical protein